MFEKISVPYLTWILDWTTVLISSSTSVTSKSTPSSSSSLLTDLTSEGVTISTKFVAVETTTGGDVDEISDGSMVEVDSITSEDSTISSSTSFSTSLLSASS